MKIELDFAFLNINENMELGPGVLSIIDWENFTSQIYDNTKDWDQEFDEIIGISEIEVSDDEIIICGFGKKTGRWVKYTFSKANISYKYNTSVKAAIFNQDG